MKRFLAPLILLIGALVLADGCHNVGAVVVTGLRVELTSIERHGDGKTVANLRVVNPNVAAYLLSGITGKVYLNGTLAGSIDLHDAIGVPQQNSAEKAVPLALAGPGAAQLLADAEKKGPVDYRLDATLVVQIYGDEKERGDVTHSGTVAVIAK